MARPVLDECMFCTDDEPCSKHAPKVKATPKPRKRTAAPIVESNNGSVTSSSSGDGQKADVTAAMMAASKIKRQGNTIKADHDAQDETAWILEDPELVLAIQAMRPLMHATELRRFEKVFAADVDPKARAAAWKVRHGLG